MTMKTKGELEASICDGIRRFEQQYVGRGPKDTHTFLIGDLLVVRLQGVLTAAEHQLAKSRSAEKGRGLLKQVRFQLLANARSAMEAMVREITGVEVLSVHHDLSTVTGEEVILFSLSRSPLYREIKRVGKRASAPPFLAMSRGLDGGRADYERNVVHSFGQQGGRSSHSTNGSQRRNLDRFGPIEHQNAAPAEQQRAKLAQ